VPLIVRFPDGWKRGTTLSTPVSLLDLLPTFNDLAGFEEAQPHSGDSLLPLLEAGEDPERVIYSQAHEAVGMPCIMARQGRYKYNYIHGYEPQLFDLEADPKEWSNLAGQADHQETADRLRTMVLRRFGDPDDIHQRNLESLYRRRLIAGVMKDHGRTWSHDPCLDHRKGALQQYLP
jgi:choline-sulfatase